MKIVMIGTGNIADVAYECFKWDSPHEVVAFSVERDFMQNTSKYGKPIVPLDELQLHYPPEEYGAFVSVGYGKLNHLRARLYKKVKKMGYTLVSYISSAAFVWNDVKIGDNCFILEDNVLQPFVEVGNNVILWSGNHIGHGTKIKDHVYIASHVVISGFVEIGDYTFVGVNATFVDDITVGKNCLIGAGALIASNTKDRVVYSIRKTKPMSFENLSPKAKELYYPHEVD